MKIITEQCVNRTVVNVPFEYLAAINLPQSIPAETAFSNRKEWADYLYLGPIRVESTEGIKSVSMIKFSDLPDNYDYCRCVFMTDDELIEQIKKRLHSFLSLPITYEEEEAKEIVNLCKAHYREVFIGVIKQYRAERSEYVSKGYKDAYELMENNLTEAINKALE